MAQSVWGYDSDNGPERWHENYPLAKGDKQSPIEINSKDVQHDPSLSSWHASYDPGAAKTILNNGRTCRVVFDDTFDRSGRNCSVCTCQEERGSVGQLGFGSVLVSQCSHRTEQNSAPATQTGEWLAGERSCGRRRVRDGGGAAAVSPRCCCRVPAVRMPCPRGPRGAAAVSPRCCCRVPAVRMPCPGGPRGADAVVVSAVLRGGPLTGAYRLRQLHLHWGSSDLHGSEHIIDGVKYAAELHMVHWNPKHGNFAGALKQPDGVAVVGIFLKAKVSCCKTQYKAHRYIPIYHIKVGKTPKPEMKRILEEIENIKTKGKEAPFQHFDPSILFPKSRDYWTYHGSFTTPPCEECITWILLREPIEVSSDQMAKLRSLSKNGENDPLSPLVDNWRPPQPLKGRIAENNPDNSIPIVPKNPITMEAVYEGDGRPHSREQRWNPGEYMGIS
ncbi:hypothetical protein Nmel_001249 [Mimus melanotis]